MPTSLTTLVLLTRQRADMVNSTFVDTETELKPWLQDSYRKLYDLLTGKNQDYYLNDPTEFSLSGTNKYALPSDFYKLLGVDVSVGGKWHELDPFNFNERNVSGLARRLIGRYADVRYRAMGTNLHITPADRADGTYRMWYYPTCPELATTQALDAVAEKWREFIVVDSAIKCLDKEESDSTALRAERADLERRIEAAAASVDVGRSARIQDVRRGRYDDDDGGYY